MPTRKRRVFISFDYDNDKVLKDFIVGQSKNADSPFDIADWSMKEAAPERNWESEAKTRIIRCDTLIVMLGPKTYKASGVLREVGFAHEYGKQIFQIIGYKEGNYTPVTNAGRVYQWDWDNLKKLLPPISV